MKVAFAGTPEFARAALEQIDAAGFEVPLVLTQPDRAAGRGLRLQPSAVKAYALQHGIAVAQPRSLRLDGKYPGDAASAREALRFAQPEVLVVAAFGQLLPSWVLDLPPLGCLNIHASLLPRWRGAAPIHRAIEAGDLETGITIMQMDEGLDTGPMLCARHIEIDRDDTTATLERRLATLGGALIVEVLQDLKIGPGPTPVPQPSDGVTYANKISKDEAVIDWRLPAALIERRLRAFDPFPGATALLDREIVKCWSGRVARMAGPPGEVLSVSDRALRVGCGVDSLDLTELQRAGGRRLGVRDFLHGRPLRVGMKFLVPAV